MGLLYSQINYRQHRVAEDFFGTNQSGIRSLLLVKASSRDASLQPVQPAPLQLSNNVWQRAQRIRHRSTRTDIAQLRPRALRRRLALAHESVSTLLRGNISLYFSYLSRFHGNALAEVVGLSSSFLAAIQDYLPNIQERRFRLDTRTSSEFLVVGSMSQRNYKAVKKVLKRKGVVLQR